MTEVIYVGTRKGLFAVRRKAGAWQLDRASFLGVPVTAVLPDARDGSVWAAVGHGHFGSKLHRSRDGGASWQEVSPPKYPPKPEGLVDINPARNIPVPWNVEYLWVLEAADPARPGSLLAGTIPGGLFRTDDGAASWSIVRPLWDMPERQQMFGGGYDFPGIHSICVDPRDARRMLVAFSCGGVWGTEDAGQRWQVRSQGMRAEYMPPEKAFDPIIQDPHRVVLCPAAPGVLWSQHHNGVFRSTDGAQSWTEITSAAPSKFGFAVAVHPRDPETAWFVPAVKDEMRVPVDGAFVVSRTRDGGKSFEVLRAGLPQRHAYDLVYRHGLDVDATGEQLVMGSTTGSLWTTANQGDEWSAVSNHLPPIYCVRFG
jgi:photosystem II stability/assembly factor-like uncharacterized protein